MSAEQQRLLQALEHFSARTRGAKLADGVQEAIKNLQSALAQPMPGHDTPGMREALKAAPGTGVPMEQAVKGPDQPSPGQKEARSLSQQIQDAASEAVERVVAQN